MASSGVVIRQSFCPRRFSNVLPPALFGICDPVAFSQSIDRINAANVASVGPRLAAGAFVVLYVLSLVTLTHGGYDGNGVNSRHQRLFIPLVASAVVSFVSLLGATRFGRLSRAANLNKAVMAEHAMYSMQSPPVAWRVVKTGLCRLSLEINGGPPTLSAPLAAYAYPAAAPPQYLPPVPHQYPLLSPFHPPLPPPPPPMPPQPFTHPQYAPYPPPPQNSYPGNVYRA